MAAEITIRLITGRAYCFVLASGCATGAGICFGVAAVLCAGAGMCSVTVGDPCTPDMGVFQSRSKLIAAYRTELRSVLGGRRTGRMGGKSKILIAIRCLTGVPVTACVLAPSALRNVAAEITVRLMTDIAYCFVLAGNCATGMRGFLSVGTTAGILFPVVGVV